MDVVETVIAMRRSVHFIRTQRKGDQLAPLGYFVLARRLWHRLTSCRLVDSMQPGGLAHPVGWEAATGLIRRVALDAVSGQ